MRIQDFNARMKARVDSMPADFSGIIASIISRDVTAIVRNRVENRGVDSDGTPFESFSRNKIGSYSAWWGSVRQKTGRQVQRVDFNYTGDMWANFGQKEATNSNGIIRIVIGGKSGSSQRKINENSEIFRRSIIELSDSEIEQVKTTLKDEAIKFVKQKMGFK